MWVWSFGFWLAITWTFTVEQLVSGASVALGLALALAPLGGVIRPWTVLDPRRLPAAIGLGGAAVARIVTANLTLARRIWSPSLPLRSGMVVVPTTMTSEGGLAAVGLITSVIVDNQLVDVDRTRRELLYHAVEVPPGTGDAAAARINLPIERRLKAVGRGTT